MIRVTTLILSLALHAATTNATTVIGAPPLESCESMLSTLEQISSVEVPPEIRRYLIQSIAANPEQTVLTIMTLLAANPSSPKLIKLYEAALHHLTGSRSMKKYEPRLHHQGGIAI